MFRKKAIENPKISNKKPDPLAINDVLKFVSKAIAKDISKNVASPPTMPMREFGTQGFNFCVYAINSPQFPQADNSLLQNPNLSATAESGLTPYSLDRIFKTV